MKTAKQKARRFIIDNIKNPNRVELIDALEILLKEQDRDTRHACAEAVLKCKELCESPTGGMAINPDDAHAACMNVKAV